MPDSVRVGEIVKVDVTVFNYFMNKRDPNVVEFDVTLSEIPKSREKINCEDKNFEYHDIREYDDEEFKREKCKQDKIKTQNQLDFYELKKIAGSCRYIKFSSLETENSLTRRISVNKGSEFSTSFFIKVKEAGNILIKVHAKMVGLSSKYDEVHRTLLVKHDEITCFEIIPRMIKLRNRSDESFGASLHFPDDAIKNSIKMELTVNGDLIGQPLERISNLL